MTMRVMRAIGSNPFVPYARLAVMWWKLGRYSAAVGIIATAPIISGVRTRREHSSEVSKRVFVCV